MSRVKDEYQKQMAAFCEKNNTISAQDILSRAKNQPPTEEKEKVVEFKPRKSKGVVWKAAIPAVLCFLLVGTTTLAATGKLTNIFRSIFQDEKTAEIVDAGYFQEMNLVVADEQFEATIIGVSGDTANAQVAIDIYVKDEALVQGLNKIYIEAYCMSKEEYEYNLESYGTWDAYGKQDEEIPNLYHVSLRTGIWIADGQEAVLEIVKIRLGGDGKPWRNHEVSLKYNIQANRNAFYLAQQQFIDFAPFEYKGRTYSLIYVISGYYETELIFRDLGAEKPPQGSDSTREEYEAWLDFIQQVVLVVDGVEYKVIPGEEHFPYYEDNTYGDGSYTHMHPYFPAYVNDDATSVEVRCGDTVYKVK